MKKYFIIFLITFSFSRCYFPDSAGNLQVIDYPINTKLNLDIVHRYLDTLIEKRGYKVPAKWMYDIKQSDLDTTYNVRLYFKKDNQNPEEMYLISFNGLLLLSDIYRKDHWVAVKKDISKEEEIRIKTRFNSVLDTIETLAKKDRLPDSLIYFENKNATN